MEFDKQILAMYRNLSKYENDMRKILKETVKNRRGTREFQ